MNMGCWCYASQNNIFSGGFQGLHSFVIHSLWQEEKDSLHSSSATHINFPQGDPLVLECDFCVLNFPSCRNLCCNLFCHESKYPNGMFGETCPSVHSNFLSGNGKTALKTFSRNLSSETTLFRPNVHCGFCVSKDETTDLKQADILCFRKSFPTTGGKTNGGYCPKEGKHCPHYGLNINCNKQTSFRIREIF